MHFFGRARPGEFKHDGKEDGAAAVKAHEGTLKKIKKVSTAKEKLEKMMGSQEFLASAAEYGQAIACIELCAERWGS